MEFDPDYTWKQGPKAGKTLLEALQTNYSINDSGCWEWSGPFFVNGYGRVTIDRRPRKAHRASAEILGGLTIEGTFVLHSCDNRKCINPAHLRVGNAQDNMDDKVARGRGNPPVGERARAAKLSAENVRQIRNLAGKFTHKQISEMFHISRSHTTSLINGSFWRHL